MAVQNQMAEGRFVLSRERSAEFARITAPLYVFAGATDALVAPSTAAHVLDVVGSTDKRFEVAPGGHMGVILGSSAQGAVWARAADWLQARSGTRAPVAARSRTRSV